MTNMQENPVLRHDTITTCTAITQKPTGGLTSLPEVPVMSMARRFFALMMVAVSLPAVGR